MIVFVPYSPEVTKYHAPRLWQGLILILVLGIFYLFTESYVTADAKYIEGIRELVKTSQFSEKINEYLSLRPLLAVAPAKGDWDFKRLLLANFIHGGEVHLVLNLIGAFAGARICSTFLSFFWISTIFLFGGSLGLWLSLFLAADASPYVPHVGASAGIFALMGTYYVFNFKFRTRYFYWFPDRLGKIALPTSWFFFIDVILLELVLSAAQLSPARLDTVDHVAHVVGFFAGVSFAVLLRFIQQWPPFIHTKAELVFWKSIKRPFKKENYEERLDRWLRCLEINAFNDPIKFRLIALLKKHCKHLEEQTIERAFVFLTPVFCRRHPETVARFFRRLLKYEKRIPPLWLRQTPYDVVIRVGQKMASREENNELLYRFFTAYKLALPPDASFHHKLELVLKKIEVLLESNSENAMPQAVGDGLSNANANNTHPPDKPATRSKTTKTES